MVQDNQLFQEYLISWLTTSSGTSLSDAIGIRRAVLAVISRDRESLAKVLEKAVDQFGDQLYIKHAPMLQQEGVSILPRYFEKRC